MRLRKADRSVAIVHAPFFFALLRDAVHNFVDDRAARCAKVLDDEFRATAFIPVPMLQRTAAAAAAVSEVR